MRCFPPLVLRSVDLRGSGQASLRLVAPPAAFSLPTLRRDDQAPPLPSGTGRPSRVILTCSDQPDLDFAFTLELSKANSFEDVGQREVAVQTRVHPKGAKMNPKTMMRRQWGRWRVNMQKLNMPRLKFGVGFIFCMFTLQRPHCRRIIVFGFIFAPLGCTRV